MLVGSRAEVPGSPFYAETGVGDEAGYGGGYCVEDLTGEHADTGGGGRGTAATTDAGANFTA